MTLLRTLSLCTFSCTGTQEPRHMLPDQIQGHCQYIEPRFIRRPAAAAVDAGKDFLSRSLSLPVHSSGMASEQAKVCWDTKIQIQTWWGMQAENETRSRRGGYEAFIGWDWMWALEWHRMEWSNNLRQSLVRHSIGFSNDWWGYQRNFPFASTSSAGHWESLSNLSSLFFVRAQSSSRW